MASVVTLFIPIFLCFVHSLANQVDPPTNLTLSCRNMHNVLTWSYDKQQPGLKFKVFIGYLSGGPEVLEVDPPPMQADLSFLSEPDQDYYVSVTAEVEGTESAPSKGIRFSYFMDSLASQKCLVDLPSVNVTAPKPDIIKFSFIHPWLFHKQNLAGSVKPGTKKRRSHDPQLPEFEYSVMLTNQTEQHHHRFTCLKSVCEETLPVDAAQEPLCLEIRGEMKKIRVKATQDYCAAPFEEPSGKDYYIYIIVACLLFGIISAVIYMVVVKKTKASSSLPDAIHSLDHHKPMTLGIDKEQVSVPEVEAQSPTPLLLASDTIEDTPFSAPELNCHYPIGVPAEDDGVREDEEAQNAEESEYMRGKNLEDGDTVDNEEIHSGYETRPVLVRLGSDELAQGYRG